MIRITVPFILAVVLSPPALAEPGQANRPPTLLLQGDYCGPGNTAPLAPIDALDAVCARHDACTPAGRLPSRTCNVRLQRDAELLSRDPRQPEGLRALAGLLAVGAGILPSDTYSNLQTRNSYRNQTTIVCYCRYKTLSASCRYNSEA